jgi:hypothetical protein
MRKCKKCGDPVEVQSKCSTIVKCSKCLEKDGVVQEKRDYDTDEFVFCRICNKVKRRIDLHLKCDHNNLTVEQYQLQFPNAPIFAKNTLIKKNSRNEESRLKTSISLRTNWQNEEFIKEQAEKRKNRPPRTFKKLKPLTEQRKLNIKNGINSSEKMKIRRQKGDVKRQTKIQEELNHKENLQEFVICPLCIRNGKSEIESRLQFVAPSHILSHGYTIQQFNEEFPSFVFKIESIGQHHSDCLSGEKHFNFGKHLTEETRSKIAESNKKFSDEHVKFCEKCNEKFSKYSNETVCGKCSSKIYGTEDTYEKVYCRICFEMKSNLTRHIKTKHIITIEEYKNKFQCHIFSQELRDQIAKGHFGVKLDDSRIKQMIEKLNEDEIKKVEFEKKFNLNDYNYLKDIVKPENVFDDDDSVYCRFCFEKMKRITPKHLFKHKLTYFMYKQIFPDTQTTAKNLIHSTIAKGTKTKIENNLPIGNIKRGYFGLRKDLGHITRSMIEANFCRILKFNNINYLYEPQTFVLKNSIYICYTPDILLLNDFYIWERGTYIELKNKLEEDNSEIDKLNIFLEQYPDKNLIILESTTSERKNLERLYKHQIPLWENTKQNIKNRPDLYKVDYSQETASSIPNN